jgi:hypothetical protein
MAMNPVLKKLVQQYLERHSELPRASGLEMLPSARVLERLPPARLMDRLPGASVLDRMSPYDREQLFFVRRRLLEQQVARHVLSTTVNRRQFLKSARDRMNRLERTANSYGIWLEEIDQQAA